MISIHALLAESDFMFLGQLSMSSPFLSTLSLRRATSPCAFRSSKSFYFYPRSPCGERRYSLRHSTQGWHFYPRSPCGERQQTAYFFMCGKAFLSTLSLRRATYKNHHPLESGKFLSTLSLRRATWQVYNFNKDCLDFYPRSPCGERLLAYCTKF